MCLAVLPQGPTAPWVADRALGTHPVAASQDLVHSGIHGCQLYSALRLLLHLRGCGSPLWLQAGHMGGQALSSLHRDWPTCVSSPGPLQGTLGSALCRATQEGRRRAGMPIFQAPAPPS